MEYEIKYVRNRIGEFLHNYYLKFGSKKYDKLVRQMGEKMKAEYGEAFNCDNLRIMEAEYVLLSDKHDAKTKFKNKKTTFKK